MAGANCYVFYAGIKGIVDIYLIISIILISVEIIILLMNRWVCPLTPIASKFTDSRNPNFDIYLPQWLAKYNKEIFGTIFTIGIILVIANQFIL